MFRYPVAVSNDYVEPVLPIISEMVVQPPLSQFFALAMVITGVCSKSMHYLKN